MEFSKGYIRPFVSGTLLLQLPYIPPGLKQLEQDFGGKVYSLALCLNPSPVYKGIAM